MATIALFLALAGGTSAIALSGSNSVHSDDIANNGVHAQDIVRGAVRTSDLHNATVGAKDLGTDSVAEAEIVGGAVGRDELGSGAVGSGQVDNGSLTTIDLAPNALTAGAYSARVNGLTSGVGFYASPSGTSDPVAGNPTSVFMISPSTALKATDLSVELTVAPTPGTRRVTLVVNGAASSLVCTVETGTTSCTDSDVVNLPASSELSLLFENFGTVPGTDALVSFRLTGP